MTHSDSRVVARSGRTWSISTTNGCTALGYLPDWGQGDPSTKGVAPDRLAVELSDITHEASFGRQFMRVCSGAECPGEEPAVLIAHMQCSPFAQADTTTSNNRGGIPVAGNALPVSAGRTWAISTTTGYTTRGHLPAWADDDPSATGVAPERLGTELTDVLHCTTFGGQLLRACPRALDPGEGSVALTPYLQCAPYAEEPERRVPLLNLQLAGDLWLTNLDPQGALEVAEQFEDFVNVLREKAVPAVMAARTEWAAHQPGGTHGRQAGGAPDTAGPALLTGGGAGPEWATPPGTRG